MTRSMCSSRHTRGLLLLMIGLLLLGGFPARPADAATIDQPIDNTLADFARGTFQRTSLGAVRVPAIPKDETGAVQLGPIGLLRNWKKQAYFLPSKLQTMGTAAIGNRMFVIGGVKPNGVVTSEVWSAGVDVTTGGIIAPGWQAEPSLAIVAGSTSVAAKAEISSPAVASVPTSNGGGYIYVIGGQIPANTRSFSSYAVQRATVSAAGRVSGTWQELVNAKIPGPDVASQNGLIDAAAVTFTTTGGRTFIYLIGGLERFLEGIGGGAQLIDQGTRRVWYTEVKASNGLLYKPSSNGATEGWEQLDDVPLPATVPAEGGLWNTVAVADHFLTSVGSYNDALYVIGGLNTSSASSQIVYRALINPSTGALTWTTTAGPDLWQGTLPQARAGHGGAIFRGNIYLTSGQKLGQSNPDWSVLTTYVENNLRLHNWGDAGNGSDFLENPNALDFSTGNPGTPRTGHGTILVQAGPQAPNTAFLFIVGGRGATGDSDTSDDDGSDAIVMAKIGGDEDIKNTGYAPDGLYYSKTYAITVDQAQVQQISWSTQITRTTGLETDDVELKYRISNDSDCTRPSWTEQCWQPLVSAETDVAHKSANGKNTMTFQTLLPAKCFQYQARLVAGGLSGSKFLQTPSLLNVNIKISVPGTPDLSPQSVTPSRGLGNALTGLTVKIRNVYQGVPAQPTLPADYDTPNQGDFYVDLCIFGPGKAVAIPTIPNPACTTAYAMVPKRDLTAGRLDYVVTNWRDFKTDQLVNILTYFKTPGTYNVVVAVDSTDYVIETGAEANNVSTATQVIVPNVLFRLNAPLIQR